ncbi:MAG: alpha/beta fold hydrolase [Terracidiphilus sp.]
MRARRLEWLAVALLSVAVIFAATLWTWPLSFFHGYAELRMILGGAQSRSTTVEGMRIHYYVMGPEDGHPVVLVHGLGGRADDWGNLAPYLAKAGYRVYMPDLPGYGQSAKPVNFSYSVPDEAAVVVGFFDVLGLKQVDLGGWSMGGWIVQLVAAEHPERVQRLMLFDSAGISERPTWNTQLFTPTTPEELQQFYALLMPNPPKMPGFVANAILRSSRNSAWIIHRAMGSMLTGRDVTDKLLPKLKMPVLMVWGAKDRITPLNLAEKMHHLVPQSEIDVIPGCGHLAPSQCAAKIGPAVVQFVKQ